MTRIERAGERVGALLNLIYQRGLEIMLAGLSVINGRAALAYNAQGEPTAPFLYSALSQFAQPPYVWAVSLIGVGMVHFIVLAVTLTNERTFGRAMMAFVQTGVYVSITMAILTSTRDGGGPERYAFIACTAFLCFVVLTARAISEYRKGGAKHG